MKSTTLIRPAIYARVSSERQADEATIESQLAALRERVAADGLLLDEELAFVDDGYSGTTLMRPALERLRDMSCAGAFNRLYIYCPDRLVRNYAYQVLLIDELKQDAIETVFLNRSIGETPEELLLLQVQGVIAEYERAKIIERGRRGRRYSAQRGSLNAIAHAPYGYRYISKHHAGGEAYYQVVPDEADIVRGIFEWVGRDRLTLGAVTRRLHERGLRSPKGNEHWNRASICDMLKKPSYQGLAAFGKTRVGERLPRLRAPRNQAETPRRPHTCHDTPVSERISIPVPAIVGTELFAAVQEQLEENRRRSREQKCCRAFSCAVAAARLAVASTHRKEVDTLTIAAWARMHTASEDSGCATTNRSRPQRWRSPFGMMSKSCCVIPTPFARSTRAASTRARRMTPARVNNSPGRSEALAARSRAFSTPTRLSWSAKTNSSRECGQKKLVSHVSKRRPPKWRSDKLSAAS